MGAVLLYVVMHYHVIHAKDGLHWVAKTSPQLESTYVDIREFTVASWAQHADVAAALIAADKQELLEGAANDALLNGIDRWLERGTRPQ